MGKRFKYGFITTLIIFSLILSIASIRLSKSILTDVYFDIFTQKEPYNGKGLNQPSDMFGPQEDVEVYAILIKRGVPLPGKLVVFEVQGPINVSRDIHFYMIAETNSSGIAKVNFSLAVINQTASFGTWTVTGRTEVDGDNYIDTLTFNVGWIIELLYIRMLDNKLNNRIYFGIGGDVGFELTFRNNAWTLKNVSIAITIFDELNVPVNSLFLRNLVVPPQSKIQQIYLKLYIPKWAVPGKATIIAIALDEKNVPYCPAISQDFWITIDNPISIEFIDASIVFASILPQKARIGDIVTITVLIRNEGTLPLNNFYITVCANNSIIYSKFISRLMPMNTSTIQLSWDTSSFSEGSYIIIISLPYFANETETSDNTYTDIVELSKPKPVFVHDIQILKVNCSKNEVFQGETITVGILIRNNGNATESTKVKVYLNNSQIEELYVFELEPFETRYLLFQWNTTLVHIGEYRIFAVTPPVEGEVNIADNICYSDIIKIKAKQPQIVHDVAVTYLNVIPRQVQVGQTVNITICVKNLGTEPESFKVTLYYNSFPLTVLRVDFLAPSMDSTFFYVWDTSNVLEGNYTIRAVIPQLEGEENIANNQFIDGVIWIRAPQPPIKKHDVAVTSLNISKSQVYKGENVNVNIYVVNVGDYNESFRLVVYANMSEVWSYHVENLRAGYGRLLSFTWRVNLNVGRYVIWAKAEYVEGEANVENNIFIDGTLLVLSPPAYYYHDVAVIYVHPICNIAYVGQKLNVTVIVKNLGNFTESFNLTLYYDLNVAGKVLVQKLPPSAEKAVIFEWDTSAVAEGNYTLKAYAEPVEGEINVGNNVLVDGTVAVLKLPPSVSHDVAVLWLGADRSEVNVGEVLALKVVVANFGNVYENFNLTISYDSKIISIIPLSALAPYTTREVTIYWDTSNVKPGTYILSARIPPIYGEADITNNELTDGEVTLKPVYAVSLFMLILPIIIGLAIFLVIILIYHLRKRRKAVKPPKYQTILIVKPRI